MRGEYLLMAERWGWQKELDGLFDRRVGVSDTHLERANIYPRIACRYTDVQMYKYRGGTIWQTIYRRP